MQKILLAAAVVVLSAAGLFAQNRMGMFGGRPPANSMRPAPAHPAGRWTIRVGSPFGFRGHGFGRSPWSYGYYGLPYYSDFYPSYDDYESAPPPPPPAPEPAAPVAKEEPIPSPTLLELQGNQWVKVSSFTMSQPRSDTTLQTPTAVTKEMPPAVLVYRDGHTEDLTSYSIIGTSIYTKSDYWSNGAWTRTIQIADLDIPATLKANRERGVKFELPSSPNEVMIRQ